MPIETPERQGVGRRKVDEDCAAHEKRLDVMDQHIASNKGWLKGTASLVGVVGFIMVLFCTTIITKLGSISDLLTDYKVMLKQHETEINNMKTDIKDINERHKFIDQNSGSFKRSK
jgi:archaellum component FlaC